MLSIATDLTLVCRLTLSEKTRTTVKYVWRSSEIAVVPNGEVFIDDTPPLPRRPARRQARTPDPRSRLGAAAEVEPALTIP